ncbi:MAG: bifunctional 3-phosphoshikimate 1-carboxyvinyltransferase/cytidylate kinase [Cytophagales bacterium]|nr:bifunctional 3-phosphoshikimate 1-carboxyvinyltransferase/cytidylate kinase [Cytophagales bacterium]
MFETVCLDIPPLQAVAGSVRLPGSKSISNRVLLLAALCEMAGDQPTVLHDLLDSDDTRVMVAALAQLKEKSNETKKLFLGNAGTAMRPLTAALALRGGQTGGYELSGVARMHERPIGDLVDALRLLGCDIQYLGREGFPPLKIGEPKLKLDAPIRVRGDVSSQFLTALLLALPLVAAQDIHVDVVGELISKPYIDITIKLLARFGVTVRQQGWRRFTIPAGSQYTSPREIYVEADASSASYFVALGGLAARVDKPLQILGVGADSIQGDIKFIDAAAQMGVQVQSEANSLTVWRKDWDAASGQWSKSTGFLRAIDLDCNHIPDAAMTLAVMALYADGTTTLRNIASWRVKETDRISAMAAELRKLGATIDEGADYIRITPPSLNQWRFASIHTYDDHRMAMCASLAAFNPAGLPVRIEDPKCVAKTFPSYFEALFSVAQTTSKNIPVICIDGPTASGKGTLASLVAKQLGYHYLDSGALYRLVGFAATQAGVDLDDELAVATVASQMLIGFDADRVSLNGSDATNDIRSEASGMLASKVSSYPAVRQALLDRQLGFRKLPGLVADGRDMGTVIFPDAPLKVFLTANAQTRAQRRYKQLISKGISASIDALCADLEARDARDQSRSAAPLVAAKDALQLDNSNLTIEDSVAQVLSWWSSRFAPSQL